MNYDMSVISSAGRFWVLVPLWSVMFSWDVCLSLLISASGIKMEVPPPESALSELPCGNVSCLINRIRLVQMRVSFRAAAVGSKIISLVRQWKRWAGEELFISYVCGPHP